VIDRLARRLCLDHQRPDPHSHRRDVAAIIASGNGPCAAVVAELASGGGGGSGGSGGGDSWPGSLARVGGARALQGLMALALTQEAVHRDIVLAPGGETLAEAACASGVVVAPQHWAGVRGTVGVFLPVVYWRVFAAWAEQAAATGLPVLLPSDVLRDMTGPHCIGLHWTPGDVRALQLAFLRAHTLATGIVAAMRSTSVPMLFGNGGDGGDAVVVPVAAVLACARARFESLRLRVRVPGDMATVALAPSSSALFAPLGRAAKAPTPQTAFNTVRGRGGCGSFVCVIFH
jgi:hypothetical protein